MWRCGRDVCVTFPSNSVLLRTVRGASSLGTAARRRPRGVGRIYSKETDTLIAALAISQFRLNLLALLPTDAGFSQPQIRSGGPNVVAGQRRDAVPCSLRRSASEARVLSQFREECCPRQSLPSHIPSPVGRLDIFLARRCDLCCASGWLAAIAVGQALGDSRVELLGRRTIFETMHLFEFIQIRIKRRQA